MNRVAIILLVGALCLPPVLTGCGEEHQSVVNAPPPPPASAPGVVRTYDYSHKVNTSAKGRAPRKWAVAILRFGDTKEVADVPFGPAAQTPATGSGVTVKVNVVEGQTPVADTPPQMNKRAREVLKYALVNSDAFKVVERERILEVLREIQFGKTAFVDPETAPEQGQLLSVRYLIEGSLGYNEDRTLKNTIEKDPTYKDGLAVRPGLLDNLFNPKRVGSDKAMAALRQYEAEKSKQRARMQTPIACYLSVYDVHTGAIVATVIGLGGNGLEAIDDAVAELIDELSQQNQDEMLVATISGDKVYVDCGTGTGTGCKVGSRYQVIARTKPVRDRDGQVIGWEETEIGEIEITSGDDAMAIGKVVNKTGDITRGNIVRPAKH